MKTKHYTCFHCHVTKKKEDFYYSERFGRQSWCIQCHKDDRIHDGKTSEGKLYQRYGITRAELEALHKLQENKCKICKVELKPDASKGSKNYPNVDHDHITGKVRGILCFRCNSGMGLLNEDPDQLRLAAEYLEKDGNI